MFDGERRRWTRRAVILLAVVLPAIAYPTSPGTHLAVPAIARVGAWVTDLYLFNPGADATVVEILWLERGRPNPTPPTTTITLSPAETRIVEDVVLESFGLDRGEGALEITSQTPIVVNCRVFARDGDATYGQAAEVVPTSWASTAASPSHVVGLSAGGDFRSNIYALAGEDGAVVRLALMDLSGVQTTSKIIRLGAREPFLRSVHRLFDTGPLDEATLLLEVQSGSAIVGASRIDNTSSDPTTLSSWIDHDAVTGGRYFGTVHGSLTTGGIALAFNSTRELEGLEFSFPADRCDVVFSAGQDLTDDPVPLADLAEGHGFSSIYPAGGTMTWRLDLVQQPGQSQLVGSLSATGSGWNGDLAPCNGEHLTLDLDVGIDTS